MSYTSLKKSRDFRLLYKKGNSYVTHGFVCYYLCRGENANLNSTNRIGIVASKKVGNAVMRNRAKRVIREAFRLAEPKLRDKLGEYSGRVCYDFVFVARSKTPYCKSTQIYLLIEKMFSSIGNT